MSELSQLSQLSAVLAEVRDQLSSAGVECPAREARRLITAAAGIAPESIIVSPNQSLSARQQCAIRHWSQRRAAGEPISRLSGIREFYGHSFRLSRDTLEPRSDSETLIDATLEQIDRRRERDHTWRIVDVGTGTGCLLISLLLELPRATGVGVDMSQAALAAAVDNAERLGVADRSDWRVSNYLADVDETFDILISNPPYIPTAQIAHLDRSVRLFDPHLALDGGLDGLEGYRAIGSRALHVVPSGFMIFETADNDQHRVCEAVLAEMGCGKARMVGSRRDMAGIGRSVAIETLPLGKDEKELDS
ncbi:MAG: peptide chain release factor N(5)-glutamine methyltransferase [Hyphomicrobiaceae bacterium]